MLKISKDGIEINHGRYLSDASSGLLLYLNTLLLIKMNYIHATFLSTPLVAEKQTVDVLICSLLFLLNTSVGTLISISSWICLEWLNEKIFEKMAFKFKIMLGTIQYESRFNGLCRKYNLSYKNWHQRIVEMELAITLDDTNTGLSRFIIQRSTRVLLRNIAFILFLDLVYLSYNLHFVAAGCCLVLLGLLMMMAGILAFFSNVGLLSLYDKTR